MALDKLSLIQTGNEDSWAWLLLAHGAGAPMDSPFMNRLCQELNEQGIGCYRFEFSYMAKRREDNRKRPPDRQEKLLDTFRQAVYQVKVVHPDRALFIGGKSMGGRMASLLTGEKNIAKQIAGVVCYGYPFHPPGKPDKQRTSHLMSLPVPMLICQGERDPFGDSEEWPSYCLPENIRIVPIADGNHDLQPRKSSGVTYDHNFGKVADVSAAFCRSLL